MFELPGKKKRMRRNLDIQDNYLQHYVEGHCFHIVYDVIRATKTYEYRRCLLCGRVERVSHGRHENRKGLKSIRIWIQTLVKNGELSKKKARAMLRRRGLDL